MPREATACCSAVTARHHHTGHPARLVRRRPTLIRPWPRAASRRAGSPRRRCPGVAVGGQAAAARAGRLAASAGRGRRAGRGAGGAERCCGGAAATPRAWGVAHATARCGATRTGGPRSCIAPRAAHVHVAHDGAADEAVADRHLRTRRRRGGRGGDMRAGRPSAGCRRGWVCAALQPTMHPTEHHG